MVKLKSLKISVLRECVQRFLFETPHIDHQYCQSEVPKLSKKQTIEYLEKYSVTFDSFQSMSPLSFVEPVTVEHVTVETSPVEPTVEPTVEPIVEPMVEPTVESVVEPVVEPTVEPVVEPTVEPVSKPSKEKKTRKREATVRKGKELKAVVKFD
jgi:hypothetical protein